MGLLARLERGAVRNELRPGDLARILEQISAGPSSSGISVTPDKALSQASIWAGLLALSEIMGILPLAVKRRRSDRRNDVEEVRDHPIAAMLGPHGKPNGWMSSFEILELGTRQALLRGNFYAIKSRASGVVRELLPVHPKRMTVEQDADFRITYTAAMGDGTKRTFRPDDVFHLRGPSDDSVTGIDRVAANRDTIGLGIAQDVHAAKMFANGALIRSVLETPDHLSDEAFERIRRQYSELYSGVENAHKTAILERGLKNAKVGMTAEEGQLLESRKLQRSLLAAVIRVPPHMVNDLDRATFSNIEHQARQFVDYNLQPWVRRWEQALELQLLSDADRMTGVFIKLNVSALLRGDAKTRAEFYNKAISGLWMNPNEVREKEDLPPYDGGDEFTNPNIDTSKGEDEEPSDDDQPAEDRRGAA